MGNTKQCRKLSIIIAVLCGWSVIAFAQATGVANYSDASAQEGSRIVSEIRDRSPAQNYETTGIIKRKDASGNIEIRKLKSKIQLQNDSWSVTYESFLADSANSEKLTIIHRAGKPNEYLYQNSKGEVNSSPALALPFAGSDFCIGDLGLEFLYWEKHYLQKVEMRKSRVCRVIESYAGKNNSLPYSKVISWFDKETGGLLLAEAYDDTNKKIKQFEINSFKKDAAGNWQLQEMEIRDLKKRSRTQIIFNIGN